MKFDVSPVVWQSWCIALLAFIMLCAVVTDLRRRRIPNQLVLVAGVLGVVVNVLGPSETGGGLFSSQPAAGGVTGALFGALTGLTLFLPLYALRAMGAGDVKLMAGIGSFAGPADTVNLALFILVMGGMLAVLRMLWTGSTRRVLGNVMLILAPALHRSPPAFDPATQSADRMPYALAMAAGLLAYGAWRWSGGTSPFHF